MAIGDISKSSPVYNLDKGKTQDNEYEAITSVTNKPAKAADKKEEAKDEEKNDGPTFGPGGTVKYGTGKAQYDEEVFVDEYHNTTQQFTGPAGSTSYSGQTRALEARARWNYVNDVNPTDDGKIILGIDGQAQANLFRTDHGVDYKTPAIKYDGQDVLWAEANANAGGFVGAQVDGAANLNLSFSTKAGLNVRVGAFAGALVRAEGEVRGVVGGASIGVHVRGEALAGAQAWAEGSLGVSGFKASAGAFAGAAAGGAVGGDIMGVGVEATGEVWAGAGAKAGVNVSWKDGDFVFGAEAGAALGVGGSWGINVTIDTDRLVSEAQAAWNTGAAIIDQAGEDATELANDAGRLAGDAYKAVEGLVEDAADAGGDAAQATADAAEATANAAAEAAEAAAKAAADLAAAAGDAASDFWDWATGG